VPDLEKVWQDWFVANAEEKAGLRSEVCRLKEENEKLRNEIGYLKTAVSLWDKWYLDLVQRVR
jgi:hypothetical protein